MWPTPWELGLNMRKPFLKIQITKTKFLHVALLFNHKVFLLIVFYYSPNNLNLLARGWVFKNVSQLLASVDRCWALYPIRKNILPTLWRTNKVQKWVMLKKRTFQGRGFLRFISQVSSQQKDRETRRLFCRCLKSSSSRAVLRHLPPLSHTRNSNQGNEAEVVSRLGTRGCRAAGSHPKVKLIARVWNFNYYW